MIDLPLFSPDALPIEVHGLVARYGTRTILQGIDFSARANEITVIIGGSGCGKSTLLRNMMGLLLPAEGQVKLFGANLSDLSEKDLALVRSRLGVLFQNGALFTSMTVGENIAMVIRELTALPDEIIYQMVRMKLSLVGLEGAITKYPDELSGGMCKRAALARAIACDPAILFCDEPSAGLDPVVASELDDLLLDLKRLFSMAIIVVTHELASIKKIADRVVMLHAGQVLANGTLAEVMASEHPVVRDFFMRATHSGDKGKGSLFSMISA
jgi:phospholipid/cholesterol/gamma-HCH transport system ATP-binding protein